MKNPVTINARKYDGSIHRTWNAALIEETDKFWLFEGVFDFEVNHGELGRIKEGTVSFEYYFKNEWFNVFRFHEPEGSFRNFYCNINLPPTFENNILNYVDLDLDILVGKNFEARVLDQNEFGLNSQKFIYSDDVIANADTSLRKVLRMIERREFPFDTTNASISVDFV